MAWAVLITRSGGRPCRSRCSWRSSFLDPTKGRFSMAVYKRLALVALGLWIASSLIAALVVASGDTRRAALDSKLDDLDTVKAERRIVLVGSSNVGLGLSAGRLTELSGIPARNAALIAARSGLNEYFRIVMERVHANDVVVV